MDGGLPDWWLRPARRHSGGPCRRCHELQAPPRCLTSVSRLSVNNIIGGVLMVVDLGVNTTAGGGNKGSGGTQMCLQLEPALSRARSQHSRHAAQAGWQLTRWSCSRGPAGRVGWVGCGLVCVHATRVCVPPVPPPPAPATCVWVGPGLGRSCTFARSWPCRYPGDSSRCSLRTWHQPMHWPPGSVQPPEPEPLGMPTLRGGERVCGM